MNDIIFSKNVYEAIKELPDNEQLQLYKAIIKGRAPAPRCETTMNFFEKLNMLVIYGGKNENSKYGPYFNDMYFLDVETFTWIKIELNKNENFYPRGGHCACIVENEIIIELKSTPRIENSHIRQILTYMKLMRKHYGLIMNFGVSYMTQYGIKSFILSDFDEIVNSKSNIEDKTGFIALTGTY